jgi:hypothetical protein
MTREQVVELARLDVERSTDRIDRVYGWQVERILTTMRATFVLAGSIIGAWLAAAVIYQRAQLERLLEDYLQSLRTLGLLQRERGTERWIRSRSS